VEVLDVLVQPDGRHPSRVPRLGILPCLQQRRAVHGSEREIFLRFLGQSGYEPRNRVVDKKMLFFQIRLLSDLDVNQTLMLCNFQLEKILNFIPNNAHEMAPQLILLKPT
jgi:hypothetical protein